ncbi:MAG: cupredoxin domain-containing protein [Terriglobia bacterium]
MNRFKKSLLLFICLGCAGLLASARVSGAASEPRIINMTAKRYQFDPQVITVNQGERVRLNITALDRDHGIQIKGYDINKKLKKGVPATIEFTADKAGTFPFRCSVWCGLGHGRMKGELIVRPVH